MASALLAALTRQPLTARVGVAERDVVDPLPIADRLAIADRLFGRLQ
jgi:hypothetical protein